MKDEKAVNHPSHYEKGDGHIECIDLLAIICRGYKDIFANEAGQIKYLYRAGSKSEEGLTKNEKTVQDLKKLEWYLSDFYKRAQAIMTHNNLDFKQVVYYNGDKFFDSFEAELLKKEFSYDKPEEVKLKVQNIVVSVYRLTDLQHLRNTINVLNNLIESFENTEAN